MFTYLFFNSDFDQSPKSPLIFEVVGLPLGRLT